MFCKILQIKPCKDFADFKTKLLYKNTGNPVYLCIQVHFAKWLII